MAAPNSPLDDDAGGSKGGDDSVRRQRRACSRETQAVDWQPNAVQGKSQRGRGTSFLAWLAGKRGDGASDTKKTRAGAIATVESPNAWSATPNAAECSGANPELTKKFGAREHRSTKAGLTKKMDAKLDAAEGSGVAAAERGSDDASGAVDDDDDDDDDDDEATMAVARRAAFDCLGAAFEATDGGRGVSAAVAAAAESAVAVAALDDAEGAAENGAVKAPHTSLAARSMRIR